MLISPKPLSILLVRSLLCLSLFHVLARAAKQSYIVYLGLHVHGPDVTDEELDRVTDFHHEFLGSFIGGREEARKAIFCSYRRHINGFAAVIEDSDAAAISRHPRVVSVFLDHGRKLHTTHSWDFMLLEHDGVIQHGSLWEKADFGEDIIIANLDTGVWPEAKSFSDDGFGPVPRRWRGSCENDTAIGVRCNRKLIGAKYFNKGYLRYTGAKLDPSTNSARDFDGHGSHTLSTLGGNFVPGANVFGVANGTAKGGSPRARVASYKVCWTPVNGSECFDSDILDAFDTAMHDGVDVLSLSLGGFPGEYFEDGISIGSFHAVRKGIVVTCSAGNDGPIPGTVTNVSPWILTVGASTLDREFQTFVDLQNGNPGARLKGMSLSRAMPEDKLYQLITGAQAMLDGGNATDAQLCFPETLDPEKAKGKIVACLRGITARVDKGRQAAQAGAAGMILCNDEDSGNEIIADPHLLPAAHITYKDGLTVFNYINNSKNPLGYITAPTAKIHIKPAPFMAAFSSLGPNLVTPEILKPDVTAPGVNIIAAYSEAVSPTDLDFDKRRVPFNVDSGTSMSCPHVAGVVGLIKKIHPDWSPAAIRSAIMTTARTRDNAMKTMLNGDFIEATPFSFGAGHIRPNRAADPGLIYDLGTDDYLDFLCAAGYNETLIQYFSDRPYQCPDSPDLSHFNYPSISVPELDTTVTVTRRVKNVGPPGTYSAKVRQPPRVSMSVQPSSLTFSSSGEEQSFQVTFELTFPPPGNYTIHYVFGGLTWTDGSHFVRSPIVVGIPAKN
ncbi:hypothetical protein MLD38_036701 [Melastoma candidum]|uniref:Uncharacterized protein n=1 Tax=Melastoma candidum TaxID=119954 RepID=A0ACB9LL79_9MYRT|nr:hypothetical protein MLD38_036701 [Melastoma candidum]